MAGLSTDMHVHITWDSEPTEEAKSFIRLEVVKALQTVFQDEAWFAELVRTEVQKALDEDRRHLVLATRINPQKERF